MWEPGVDNRPTAYPGRETVSWADWCCFVVFLEMVLVSEAYRSKGLSWKTAIQ